MKFTIPTLAAVAILAACSAPQPAVYAPMRVVRHHDEDRPINLQRLPASSCA